jgi:hypothetical protein
LDERDQINIVFGSNAAQQVVAAQVHAGLWRIGDEV